MSHPLVTASAPILKHVFGLDKIASMLRHFPGMAMELGKVNKGVLSRGANLYFSSGVLMLGSSFINLFSGFSKNKDRKQTIELGTWLLNVVGRKLLVESIRNNELASDKQKQSVGAIEALKKSLNSIFTWGPISLQKNLQTTVKCFHDRKINFLKNLIPRQIPEF